MKACELDQACVDAVRVLLGMLPLYNQAPQRSMRERILNSDSFGAGWTDGNRHKTERVDGHGSTVLRGKKVA